MRFALASAVIFVLAAAACGGVEGENELADAVAKTKGTGSARFEVRGTDEGSDPGEITCDGEADYTRSRLHIMCDLDPFGTLEMISIGRTTYTRGAVAQTPGLPEDGWSKTDEEEASADELSPQRLLESLRDASRGTERVGEEAIGDVDTVRYRLDVDCASADLELDCEGVTPIDVWIGEDGLVRRIAYEMPSESATFEFSDFGAPVDIEAPPADEVRGVDGAGSQRPCKSGIGSPISEGRLRTALEAHGFSTERANRCPEMVAAMLTAHVTGNPVGPAVATCFVLAERPPDASATTEITDVPGGESLQLENLHCTAYATTPGEAAEAAFRRLKGAFRGLER